MVFLMVAKSIAGITIQSSPYVDTMHSRDVFNSNGDDNGVTLGTKWSSDDGGPTWAHGRAGVGLV